MSVDNIEKCSEQSIDDMKLEFCTSYLEGVEYKKKLKVITTLQKPLKRKIQEYMKINDINELDCGNNVFLNNKQVKRTKFNEKQLLEFLEVPDDYFKEYKALHSKLTDQIIVTTKRVSE